MFPMRRKHWALFSVPILGCLLLHFSDLFRRTYLSGKRLEHRIAYGLLAASLARQLPVMTQLVLSLEGVECRPSR